MKRLIALLMTLCLMLTALPAWAETPALRAYCHAFSVEASEGAVRGFGFKMGAQYGTAPYTMSYAMTKEGGSTVTGAVSNMGYVSVPGTFGSGVYTFTASVRDAAGATSTATMRVTFTVDESGNMSSAVNASVAPEEVKVQQITLSASAQTMRAGDTFALTASVAPSDAKNKEVTYATTDASVATVDASGLITAVKAGSCKIVCAAKDGSGVTAECAVIVIQSVTGISLSSAAISIPVGGTHKLTAAVVPENATNKEVTFVSGNKEVAVVANDGTVTGVDLGVATISVASKDDPTKIATCVVTVGTPVSAVEVSPKSMELKTGASMNLQVTVGPENATNRGVNWTSSNKDVATVDENGKVTVWKAGTAVITATAADGSGKSDSCTVTATGEDVAKPEDTKPEEPKPEDPKPEDPEEDNKQPAGEIAYVRTEDGGLNLRTRASSGAKRIKVIDRNDALVVVEKGSTWCYVWHEGDYGYVMTKFLSIYEGGSSSGGSDDTSAPPPANGQDAQVDTEKGGLNLRTKPSQGASRIRVIPEKGKFTVVTYGSTWCYAYYKGDYGYVMTKFVKLLDGSAPADPPATEPDTPSEPDAPDTPVSDLYGVVTTKEGRLNLRKRPDTDAGIIKRIDPGKVVTVLSFGDTWCHVDYKGTKGYVMTKFLKFTNDKPADQPTQKPVEPPVSDGTAKYAQVTTEQGRLNLRADKSTDAELLKRIPQNVYVQVLSYGSDWCYVNYNGTKGYVMTKFLTII